jgi:hypothetical protein
LILFFVTNNSAVFSDNIVKKPLIVSESQLQLLDRANQLAEKITRPENKLNKLFELLSFETQFEDKKYAQNTIKSILNLIPELKNEAVKNNFYELLAIAQSNINDYKQINVTLNNLAQSIEKVQIQFDLAEKIIYEREENKLPIPDEVIDLLQLAYTGAGIVKDTMLESLAAMQLGRVLAKSGKVDQAKNFLITALKKSDELNELESRNIKQSILRIMVQYKIYDEVMKEIAKTKSQETKDLLWGLVLQTLAEEGRIKEAKDGLINIKTTIVKDMIVVGISRETAKKGTVEELIELSKQTSSEEQKKVFIQNTISFLLENKRPETAIQLIDQVKAQTDIVTVESYNLILIANKIDDKKYGEAEKDIAAISDKNYKMHINQYLILARIRATGLKSVVGKNAAYYTETEKQKIAALNAETSKLAKIENNLERVIAGFSILRKQIEILNPDGINDLTQIVLNDIDKLDNPIQILEYQYNTARIHLELGNYDGVRDAIDRTVKFLDGVKNLMQLKELVLLESEETAAANNFTADKNNPNSNSKLNTQTKEPEVTEAMIKEQLFLTYTSICAMYIDINEIETAKKIYEKSKQYLAAADDDPIKQFDQTGILSKLLLQLDNANQAVR